MEVSSLEKQLDMRDLSVAMLDYRRGYIKNFRPAQGKCKKHVFQQQQHDTPVPCFFTARDGSAVGHRIPAGMRKRCEKQWSTLLKADQLIKTNLNDWI